ncbi:MAG: hypothetical protein GF398_03985 [Chitinivibrionales bacterium]|nr:hypothetical protein [Chitinivibrionales bacterium]
MFISNKWSASKFKRLKTACFLPISFSKEDSMSPHFIKLISFISICMWTVHAAGSWSINGNEQAILRKEFINTGNNYNHPANIGQLNNGDLIIVSVMGVSEGEQTRIACIKSTDQGESWGNAIDITPVQSAFDPTIQQADNGALFCFYYNGCCNDHKWRVSTDNGATWGPENDVHSNALALQAGEQSNCLEQPNGDWICGWSETKNGGKGYTSHIPKGKMDAPGDWDRHFAVDQFWNPDFLVVNPSQTVNGHFKNLVAFCRNEFHNVGPKWAKSNDGGQTWSSFEWVRHTVGVGCGGDGISFGAAGTGVSLDMGVAGSPDGPLTGYHIIAHGSDARYCPSFGCAQHCRRYLMRIWIGDDAQDASSWQEVFEIRESDGGGENADCSIIQAADRKVHLVWTGRGCNGIRYAKFDPDIMITGASTQSFPLPASRAIDLQPQIKAGKHALVVHKVKAQSSELTLHNAYGAVVFSTTLSAKRAQVSLAFKHLNLTPGMYYAGLKQAEGVTKYAAVYVN